LPSAVQLAPVLGHSAKSVQHIFAECSTASTRQRRLCRVPQIQHSAKATLPSARDPALDKVYFLIFKKSLPSARSRALGKERFNSVTAPPLTVSLSLSLSLCRHPLSPRRRAARAARRRAATRRRAVRRRAAGRSRSPPPAVEPPAVASAASTAAVAPAGIFPLFFVLFYFLFLFLLYFNL
jgi:hypothetical protein